MARLTKEQILQATDVDREEVEVPEWGGSVLVSGLDAQYVQHLMATGFLNYDAGDEKGTADLSKLDMVDLAFRSMIDDDGERLFTRNEAKKLGAKSWAAITRIVIKALGLSGFAAEETETELAEDDEKNE